MSKERNKAVPAVYLVLKKKGNILMMRRAGSGYFDGYYGLPSGHVEARELPVEALLREVLEEIGIKILKKDIDLLHTMYRTKKDETGDRVDLFFSVSKYKGTPKICETNKCDDIKWFPSNNLPKNIVPSVKDALKYIDNKIDYSEIK